MSWLFGVVQAAVSEKQKDRFRAIHPVPRDSFETQQLYVAAGGIEETCKFGLFPPTESGIYSGWAVVGSGIKRDGNSCAFVSSEDWQAILTQSTPELSHVDGHYCLTRWSASGIEVWIDPIGLRTLYVAPVEGGYCFSTRLPWITHATGLQDVCFEEFGATWLLANKMSYGCLVNGIARIGPGGRATITAKSFTSRNSSWRPDISEASDPSRLAQSIRAFIHPRIPGGKILSLGLSGGFDSRFLLSQLDRTKTEPFVLHTFGADANPDAAIPKRIAGDLNIHIDQYNEPLPNVDVCVSLMKSYVAQTCLATPVSLLLKLRYYDTMRDNKRVLIDGAYGEIVRRQLGNRLRRRGSGVLRDGKFDEIFSLKKLHRASIFHRDVEATMRKSALQEIAEVWSAMPSVGEIGIENFIDLFAMRTLAANSCHGPQDWIDSRILNFMPFTQPSLLRLVFRTPLQERRNARFVRKILFDSCPELRKYPLAKEGITYPYALTTIPAWIWRKAKATAGKKYEEAYALQLLLRTQEFVQDIVRSRETRSFSPYDHKKIAGIVDGFYSGKRELASQVDWWLTFELWRRSLTEGE